MGNDCCGSNQDNEDPPKNSNPDSGNGGSGGTDNNNNGGSGGDDTVTTGPGSGGSGGSSGSGGGLSRPGDSNGGPGGSTGTGSGGGNPATVVVTRYEIREMDQALQNRFFDAVDKMLETKNGVAGTSEFYRVASYHGSPAPIYCKHGRETFPGWHRIYLMEFEKALQVADRANGNDGNIGLAYWDWTINPSEGLPDIVRQRFASWPADLFPPEVTDAPSSLTRATDARIGQSLIRNDIAGDANDSLLSTQHFAHASTGGEWATSYPSLESPHNSVHGIVGGNGGAMGSVAWAAYDIAFWLHHCNIDRIYETYLAVEPDSRDEFEATKDTEETDEFEVAFEPFLKENGEPYYPHDTFDTRALGYVYNTPFPQPNANQLRLAPTVAMFPTVKVSEFESKCYQIHVYVVNKNEEEKFAEPVRMDDINMDADNYGGFAAIFGRGMECKNCTTRKPYDIVVDITKTLGKLQLSRYDAILKTYLLETTETSDLLIKVQDSPLPIPSITGPLFEDTEASLDQEHKDAQKQEEVLALQRYLQRFGYYDSEMDGSYGPVTEKAVKIFQEATGSLKIDGIAGKMTKGTIRGSRRCSNKDPFGDNNVKDDLVDDEKDEMYGGNKNILFHIGRVPGYLKRRAVVAAIEQAFNLWSKALDGKVRFNIVQAKPRADITLSWSKKQMRENDLMRFDGPGGVLGHGGYKSNEKKGFVEFDRAERWVVGIETPYNKDEPEPSDPNDPSSWYRGQPTISLFYVAVHELGHALGLDHSINANDFMSPFYNYKKKELSENDAARVKEQFGIN